MPEELWREVRNIVQEAAMRTQGNKSKKATWLSQEAPRMAQERREAKVKRERERFAQLNAEFQRIARRDRRVLLEEQCREVEDNSRIGKSKDLFKKIRGTREPFHAKTSTIKYEKGRELTNIEQVKSRVESTLRQSIRSQRH
ncbi:hypothetical protein M513_07721 [Trichuris suis]|uniref:Uncharacterized protein n=1 Tax=Trichuris suis TaxID=68888 RepID=A0A085M270_9BILA|nr:hypothetical protein M513_07721 [Trichuris suis]